MALTFPVNLMSTTASPPPVQSTADTTTVAPVTASSSAGGANTNGSPEQDTNSGNAAPQSQTKLAHAEPQSLFAAGIEPPKPASDVLMGARELALEPQSEPRSDEVDRYAPPNPLPTAPILQAAASYEAVPAPKDR